MGFFKEVITEIGLSYADNSTIEEVLERNFSIFSENPEADSETDSGTGKFEKDIFTLDLFGSACDGDAQFVKGY